MNNNEDNEIDSELPLQYLNNENPFSFAKEYFNNEINGVKNKERLNSFMRIQQSKSELYLDPHSLAQEKKLLIESAIEKKREFLIEKGLSIIGAEPVTDPLLLFESHFYNKEIVDIAIKLRKLDLFFSQMRIRLRVGQAIPLNYVENFYDISEKSTYDNFKEALGLEILFSENE